MTNKPKVLKIREAEDLFRGSCEKPYTIGFMMDGTFEAIIIRKLRQRMYNDVEMMDLIQ